MTLVHDWSPLQGRVSFANQTLVAPALLAWPREQASPPGSNAPAAPAQAALPAGHKRVTPRTHHLVALMTASDKAIRPPGDAHAGSPPIDAHMRRYVIAKCGAQVVDVVVGYEQDPATLRARIAQQLAAADVPVRAQHATGSERSWLGGTSASGAAIAVDTSSCVSSGVSNNLVRREAGSDLVNLKRCSNGGTADVSAVGEQAVVSKVPQRTWFWAGKQLR